MALVGPFSLRHVETVSGSKKKGVRKDVQMQLSDPKWVTGFQQFVAEDPEVKLNTRWARFNCLVEIGDRPYLLKVDEGVIKLKADPTLEEPWDFAVRGSLDAWQRFANGDTDPEYRDILGMVFQGIMSVTGEIKSHLVLEGNYQKLFANLQPLYAILSKIRETEGV